MKFILFFSIWIISLIGLWLISRFSLGDSEFIVIIFNTYTIKLPILLCVLLLMMIFTGLYLFFNFFFSLFRIPKKLENWNKRKIQSSIERNIVQGYVGLIEGQWSKAEYSLVDKLNHNQSPLINYLGAAYAAQKQGALHRSNEYLDEALSKQPKQYLSINLTRSRLLYQSGEIEKAREYLEELHKRSPKNVHVAKLLANVYRDLGDWYALVNLFGSLEKLKAFPTKEFDQRAKIAYDHFLSSKNFLKEKLDHATNNWKSLPYSRQKNPIIVAGYAKQLIESRNMIQAEKVLRKAINRKFDSGLVYLYGKTKTDFVTDQIKLVSSWARTHEDDENIRLTLARLYRRNEEFLVAQKLLKTLVAEANPIAAEEACSELGALLEQIGETESALIFYKKGISMRSIDLNFQKLQNHSGGELVALNKSKKKKMRK